MATENAVSIIVGGWFEQPFPFTIPDLRGELFVQFIGWCVRLHNPTIFNGRFWLENGGSIIANKKKNRRRFVSTEKARTDPPCNRSLNRPGQDRALPSPSPSKIRSYESISMILIPMDRPEDSREGARVSSYPPWKNIERACGKIRFPSQKTSLVGREPSSTISFSSPLQEDQKTR